MVQLRDDLLNHVVTWAEVHCDSKYLVRKLLALGPWKGIVALTRGGLVPATIIAREMEIRVVDTLCITTYDEQVKGSVSVLKVPEQAAAEKGAGSPRDHPRRPLRHRLRQAERPALRRYLRP